jgi:hypothetical protein
MFNQDDEEDFLDDILRKAQLEEEEEIEKERIKNLLHTSANKFYEEISKDEKILTRDTSIEITRKKTFLENMLNLFVEFEEYEKCADVQRWKQMIEKDVKHTRRKTERI